MAIDEHWCSEGGDDEGDVNQNRNDRNYDGDRAAPQLPHTCRPIRIGAPLPKRAIVSLKPRMLSSASNPTSSTAAATSITGNNVEATRTTSSTSSTTATTATTATVATNAAFPLADTAIATTATTATATVGDNGEDYQFRSEIDIQANVYGRRNRPRLEGPDPSAILTRSSSALTTAVGSTAKSNVTSASATVGPSSLVGFTRSNTGAAVSSSSRRGKPQPPSKTSALSSSSCSKSTRGPQVEVFNSITCMLGIDQYSFEELRVDCYSQSYATTGAPPKDSREGFILPPSYAPWVLNQSPSSPSSSPSLPPVSSSSSLPPLAGSTTSFHRGLMTCTEFQGCDVLMSDQPDLASAFTFTLAPPISHI